MVARQVEPLAAHIIGAAAVATVRMALIEWAIAGAGGLVGPAIDGAFALPVVRRDPARSRPDAAQSSATARAPSSSRQFSGRSPTGATADFSAIAATVGRTAIGSSIVGAARGAAVAVDNA